MAEEKRTCETCQHNYLGPGYEPCQSCDDDCSNWTYDHIGEKIEETVAKKIEGKEKAHVYFVFYHWYDGKGHSGPGNTGVELDFKIRTMADVEAVEVLLKNKLHHQLVLIHNWKELEGLGE